MEAWFLQIANCFDKATKQQERKIWQNKELAINSKENIESLLCKVNFVDNYKWKIKIIQSLRTKIIESYKTKIAKSCCRSSWRAKHAWKQCKECINNNTMQKNENRNMMRRTKIKDMKKFMTKTKHTQTSLLLAKKTYKRKLKP